MAYNTNGIQLIQGTLTSDQVNAMNTSPPTLLLAPGPGLVNYVVATFFNVIMGSVAYNDGDFGNVWLVYGSSVNDQTNLASAFLTNQMDKFSAGENYIFGCGSGIGSDWLGGTTGNIKTVFSVENAIDLRISITCSNPITAAGNGSINYSIWYATLGCS